ncbi:hypothetical protein PCANC_05264 [Puccinia coronata f. sp. avenae]|uniref:Uncharacterized protein n=1 Tax=Puccinia coronata f. sp. avenae TaxID=200324 RepID=A0A2N5VYV5_9BASI|nr:hypothetical protein PCANC_05264 [Puccinia coronata f. sp. avenae]
MPHAVRTPTNGVRTAGSACGPAGQACWPCTPGTQGTLIRVPFGTLIRVPRVPFGTLIRVPNGTLIFRRANPRTPSPACRTPSARLQMA